jgi:hypothetical protein
VFRADETYAKTGRVLFAGQPFALEYLPELARSKFISDLFKPADCNCFKISCSLTPTVAGRICQSIPILPHHFYPSWHRPGFAYSPRHPAGRPCVAYTARWSRCHRVDSDHRIEHVLGLGQSPGTQSRNQKPVWTEAVPAIRFAREDPDIVLRL